MENIKVCYFGNIFFVNEDAKYIAIDEDGDVCWYSELPVVDNDSDSFDTDGNYGHISNTCIDHDNLPNWRESLLSVKSCTIKKESKINKTESLTDYIVLKNPLPRTKMVDLWGVEVEIPEFTLVVTVDFNGDIKCWTQSMNSCVIVDEFSSCFYVREFCWEFDQRNEYGYHASAYKLPNIDVSVVGNYRKLKKIVN